MRDYSPLSAFEIAHSVARREFSAEEVTLAALGRISTANPLLNCFSAVFAERALAAARAVDRCIAQGRPAGRLAGVPIAVKNLFDVEGVVTLAGSKINREHEPAARDAVLLTRLTAEGAILVGSNTMDEYAYGFTTENAHDGACRNPHAPDHVAGGSSGGSAAAVAAALVPLSLGSDTNGSIRVPASFCGIFGLKPTYGRLARTGSFPFVFSLDHLGPFARSVGDLALAYDIMQGWDGGDPGCANRAPEPASTQLAAGIENLRAGNLGGWFRQGADPAILTAVDRIADFLRAEPDVVLPEANRARAAAFCITAAEGGNLHLDRLRRRVQDFDFATRDRLLAGALLPAAVLQQAQRFRQWFRTQVMGVFDRFDILLAPSTPCVAPLIGQKRMMLGDQDVLVRPNIGIFTQVISFIGLPVVAVPVWLDTGMPCGVQIIAPPWHETRALAVAAALERAGLVQAKLPRELP